MQGHWAPPFFVPFFCFYSPFPSPLLDDRNWSSPGVRGRAYVNSYLLFTYILYYLFILFDYFSSFDTIFDWLTPLSAMF